ncbi:MAG: ribose 5-phosphate isomerase B [Lachnospiraceae bacterium]|nr:ribose 5-phosphate isomerase B [Lachnospiraceae bacterium]
MKIAIGSDHGGFDMKEAVIAHLKEQGHEVNDVGCYDKKSCDYPPYGRAVAHAVADGTCDKGIVICTTGIGISITANKVPGIRAALCSDTTAAYLTRAHNDANVLAMGGGMIGMNVAIDIVDTFLNTEFSGLEKHKRRIAGIE